MMIQAMEGAVLTAFPSTFYSQVKAWDAIVEFEGGVFYR